MAQPGDGAAAAGRGHQRASHADRERVIGMLKAAFAAGLLSKDELDLGVDRTLASRTYADLAAATAGLRAQRAIAQPQGRPARPLARPENAAAWGVCGLIMTAFLTIVVVPSGTTMGVVVVTAGVIYGVFWLLAGIVMLAIRRGWLHLAAGNGPDDQKRLRPRRDRVGQRGVRRLVGQVLLAGEEPHERPALLRDVVADRPAQHRIAGLERVEDRALRDRPSTSSSTSPSDARQRPQMCGQHDSDHGSVCTSTDSTAGRSRTIGAQLSPASAEAYTCPPVVPKYTPHESSESTAIASRSTLT